MLIFLYLLNEEDREDFRTIYEENYLKMYHAAFHLLHHHEDAENAVQESFLSLAKHYERYKDIGQEKMLALCLTIARNKAIDIIRKKSHFSDSEPEENLMQQSNMKTFVERYEENESFLEIVSMLSEPLKIVLVLKYFHEFNNKEIAEILGIPKTTVEIRLYRAKKKIKEVIENDRKNI